MAKRTCAITFPYRFPQRLHYIINGVHFGALITVVAIDALLTAKMLAAICLLGSLLVQARLWRHLRVVKAVKVEAPGTVSLLMGSHQAHQLCREQRVILQEIFATRFLVILTYRFALDSRWRRQALLVTPRTMLSDDFRRFNVVLNTLNTEVFQAPQDEQ